MTEGELHKKAVIRLIELLLEKGFQVEKDMQWKTGDPERVLAYYPDVVATKTIVVEVNGKVGHSSKRSYENEQNAKAYFERLGIKMYTYSPQELVGNGWKDSKGRKHTPHKDEELFADWGL